jgi:hypothetical protein
LIADAATSNISRHSVHRRRMAQACAARQIWPQVDHDPAAAPNPITRRGGSRSRREVDPS